MQELISFMISVHNHLDSLSGQPNQYINDPSNQWSNQGAQSQSIAQPYNPQYYPGDMRVKMLQLIQKIDEIHTKISQMPDSDYQLYRKTMDNVLNTPTNQGFQGIQNK